MNEFAFIILAMVLAVMLWQGLKRRDGLLQLPFLAAAVTAGWFMPQAYRLIGDETLPIGGYVLTLLYASACLIVLTVGWNRSKKSSKIAFPTYSYNRLLFCSAALSIIGLAAYGQIFRVDAQHTEEGLTTGIVTVLFFFAKLQYFGLAIAIMLVMRRFSWIALAIVLVDFNSIMGFVLYGGRRGPAVFVIMIILTALWFERRILIPRMALIAGIVAGAVLVNGIAIYRRFVTAHGRVPTISELMDLNIISETTGEGPNYEANNAIHYIAGTFDTSGYDFGAQYWNFMVFSYVPGQFVGAGTKAALTIPTQDNAIAAYGYLRHIGTTFTGFADSFISFSFLGVFVFYIVGTIMRRWWDEALLGGMRGKVLYASTIATALHGITHSTQWFFVFVLQALIFILPALMWSRIGVDRMFNPPTEMRRRLVRQFAPHR